MAALNQEIYLGNNVIDCGPSGYIPEYTSGSGVTFTTNPDHSITVSGTAASDASACFDFFHDVSSFPLGIIPGQSYRIKYSSSNVNLRIYYYTTGWSTLITTKQNAVFTIPANAVGMSIRIFVSAGESVTETVHPYIFSTDFYFDKDHIDDPSSMQNVNLIEETLSIDTFSATVYYDGTDYTRLRTLPFGTQLHYFVNGSLHNKAYINKIERRSKTAFKLDCVSAVGILDKNYHTGGVYSGTTFRTLARQLVSNRILTDVPDDTSFTYRGVTVTCRDGYLTLDGTTTGQFYFSFDGPHPCETATTAPNWLSNCKYNLPVIPGHRYRSTMSLLSGSIERDGRTYTPETTSPSNLTIELALYRKDAAVYDDWLLRSARPFGSGSPVIVNDTITGGAVVYVYHTSGVPTTFNNAVFKAYIEDLDDISYAIDDDVSKTRVFGWLPYDTKRNNLHQIMFAENISLLKDENCDMHFAFARSLISDCTEIVNHPSGRGVTFTVNNDGTITVTGATTTQTDYADFFTSSTSFPPGMHPGGTYQVKFSGTNVIFRVYYYVASWAVIQSGTQDFTFTIPSNATGLILRILVNTSTTVNETVNPFVYVDTPTVSQNNIYVGGAIQYPAVATKINVTEHSYQDVDTIEPVTLIDNSDQIPVENKLYLFDQAPIVTDSVVTTDDLRIVDLDVNYAIVTGKGTLTGRPYYDKQTIIERYNTTTGEQYTVSVDQVTLITGVNSENVADRLLSYYTSSETVSADVKISNEKCGRVYQFIDMFGDSVRAFLTKMTSAASSFFKAACTFVAGYVPDAFGNNYEYWASVTGTGTITIQQGTKIARFVIIGGGDGGSSGLKGIDDFEDLQAGSTGGAGGFGGNGGRILEVVLRNPTPGAYTCVAGSGGAGGLECTSTEGRNLGGTGSASTVTTPGGTVYSSNDSGSYLSVNGIKNLFTNDVYACKGRDGCKGGNGGRGSVSGNGEAGEDLVWDGVTYRGGQGGKGLKFQFTHVQQTITNGGAGGWGAQPYYNGQNGGSVSIIDYYDETASKSGYQAYEHGHFDQAAPASTARPSEVRQTQNYGEGGDGGHGGAGRGGFGSANDYYQASTDPTSNKKIFLNMILSGYNYTVFQSSNGGAANNGRKGIVLCYADKELFF